MEHAYVLLNIHYPLSLEYGKQSLVDVPLVVTKLTVDHISLELNQPKSEADQWMLLCCLFVYMCVYPVLLLLLLLFTHCCCFCFCCRSSWCWCWRIVFAVLYFCPFFVCFVVVVAAAGGGSGDDDDVVDDDDIVVVVVVVEFLSCSRTYVQHDWPVFIRCYIMA